MTRSSLHKGSTNLNRATGRRTSGLASTSPTCSCWRNSPTCRSACSSTTPTRSRSSTPTPPRPGFAGHDLPLDQLIQSHKDERQPHRQAGLSGTRRRCSRDRKAASPTRVPSRLPKPNWWSATLRRIDTDRWGSVVVTLAVDTTDQVRARHLLEERERRRVALQQRSPPFPATSSSPPSSRLPMPSSPPYRPT